MASGLVSQGKYEEAEKLHQRALGARESIPENEHPDTLGNVNNLEVVLYSQGKYGAAEKSQRRVLIAIEKILGKGTS